MRANERMLTDGFYAEVTLEYDPVIAQECWGYWPWAELLSPQTSGATS